VTLTPTTKAAMQPNTDSRPASTDTSLARCEPRTSWRGPLRDLYGMSFIITIQDILERAR
jgi:hypothetical protein